MGGIKGLPSRSELLSWTRGVLRRHGIRPRQRLGQHFVVDPRLIDLMIRAADVGERDTVLEIGAGIGTLTRELAARARRVIAVEIDPRLVEVLKETVGHMDNVEIVNEDFLKMEPLEVDKVVSNVPYNISSPLIERLLLEFRFKVAALTLQLEFARRMCARPGEDDYGRLTVFVYYHATVEEIAVFPPESFYPPPKVRSCLVRLIPRASPPFALSDERLFLDLVRELFSQRGRTVRRALRVALRNLGLPESLAMEILSDARLAEARVETLSPEDFAQLSEALASLLRRRS